MGTSSGTVVVEKVLIGEEEKKEQKKEFELAQFDCLMGYLAPKSSLIIASIVINH